MVAVKIVLLAQARRLVKSAAYLLVTSEMSLETPTSPGGSIHGTPRFPFPRSGVHAAASGFAVRAASPSGLGVADAHASTQPLHRRRSLFGSRSQSGHCSG